jgi:subtilisin family serine protease
MPKSRLVAVVAVPVVAAGLALVAPESPAVAAGPTFPAAFTAYLQADRSGEQWSLTATHAAAAWTKATGTGVVVAVVDTCVDDSRPDLSGALVAGAHLSDNGTTILSGSGTDLSGHGTHVAGIIAGDRDGHGITGIAPGAKIMPIDIDNPDLSGVAIGNAIHWAVDHHADIVNLSLGVDDLPLFADNVKPVCDAAAYAESRGVLVVASAGNDGQGDNFPEAPAACGTVLSVAALDSTMRVTAWSSFDGSIDLAAPGDAIYSTVPTFANPTGFGLSSGTSMAAPFVAGVSALVLQQHPTWTPAQVRSRLESTAEDTGPLGFDPRNGFGAVDPAAAVGASAPAPSPAPALTANAFGFGDKFDDFGLVISETLVSWVPDPTATVTGYTVTTYTPSGTTVKSLPATAVRWETPTTTGGYVVTALTAAGPITAPPVWYSKADDTPPSSFQVLALQKLKAVFTTAGQVIVSWTNPAANKGHADGVFISLNGETVASHMGAMPTHLTIPASRVPPGDLTVDVFVQSSQDSTLAVSHTKLGAHVPFIARGSRIGTSRYRITLILAPSWGRRACGSARCNGARLKLVSGGRTYSDYLDEHGQAVFTVSGKARVPYLVVKVNAASSKFRLLNVARIHVGFSPIAKH